MQMFYALLVCSLLFSEHCQAALVCSAPLKYHCFVVYPHFDFALFLLADGAASTCFPQNVCSFGKQYRQRNSRCFQPVRLLQLRLAASVPTAVCQVVYLRQHITFGYADKFITADTIDVSL